LLGLLASPVVAGTPADPDVVDECGLGLHTTEQPAPPFHDFCGAWFETLPGPKDKPTVIRITMEMAGDVQPRTSSIYSVRWLAGNCGFFVQRNDDGRTEGPAPSNGPATVEFGASCEPPTIVPCEYPIEQFGFTCFELPDPRYFDVSAGYVEAGRRISWTVRFDGPFAEFADKFDHGDILREPSAVTGPVVAGDPLVLAYCNRRADDPWDCRSQTGNLELNGRDYIVGS
jgi:hypothetical protein